MNKENLKEKLKKYQVYVLALFLVVCAIGITYAAFIITRESGENTITTGQISMSYIEPDNSYVVENALPIKDSDGIGINKYFEFTVSSHATTNEDDNEGVTIPYNVTLGKLSIEADKLQLLEKEIKVYITKVENGIETAVLQPTLISALKPDDNNNYVALTTSNTHKNGSEEVTITYRLRAWIDYGVEASKFTKDNRYQYKFNVNVNSKVEVGESSSPVIMTANLANNWKDSTENEYNFLALYTLDTKTMPDTYTYNNVQYTKSIETDVSEQKNGSVILGEYKDSSNNVIALIGQDGGVVAPVDSSELFGIDVYYYLNNNLTPSISKIKYIDLSNFDTSNTEDMSWMFGFNPYLTNFDMSNFNTSKVKNMRGMFSQNSLTSLNVSNFDTSNVLDMSWMFSGQNNLTSLDISDFDTSKVTDMSYMFYGSPNLTSLDLTNFKTSEVVNMAMMFADCGFSSLGVSDFDTSNVTNMYGMFSGCYNLTSLNLQKWNTSKVENMSGMFASAGVTSLDLSTFDVSKVTDMSSMFNGCENLTNLNLKNWNTSNVLTMENMFGVTGFTTIDVSHFNVEKVTTMRDMFRSTKLTSIDLSSWNTASLEDMGNMFYINYDLSSINLSNFKTNNVTDMSSLFSEVGTNVDSFTILGLSSWNVSNVNSMAGMFSKTAVNATSFSIGDLSNWNTQNVTSMKNMFNSAGKNALWSLDCSKWNVSKITKATNYSGFNSNVTTKVKAPIWVS